MEQKKFAITKKSSVKPLYIEVCEELHGNILYRRRYQRQMFIYYHNFSRSYFTIEYKGLDSFSYERLIEFLIDNQSALNKYLN